MKLSTLLKPKTVGIFIAELIAEMDVPYLHGCVVLPDEFVVRGSKTSPKHHVLSLYAVCEKAVHRVQMKLMPEDQIDNERLEHFKRQIAIMVLALDLEVRGPIV